VRVPGAAGLPLLDPMDAPDTGAAKLPLPPPLSQADFSNGLIARTPLSVHFIVGPHRSLEDMQEEQGGQAFLPVMKNARQEYALLHFQAARRKCCTDSCGHR